MRKIAAAVLQRAANRLAVALGLIGLIAPALAADLTVRITDAAGQPMANAAITATWTGAPVVSGSNQTAVVSQRHLKFHPHMLIIPVGTSVTFPNYDRTRHQVYSFSKAKTFNLKLYVGRPQRPVVFDKTGVVTLGCDIHDFMQAFIRVTNKPRWAVSNAQGQVMLHNLPDRRIKLSIWHPWMPNEDQRIDRTVNAGAKLVRIRLNVTPPPTARRAKESSLQEQFDRLAQ